jgi:hypothetical protein|tara:strand:+ start:153 stop:524 length:372 start_codon:yes stop_codon:yes gene_type:complete
VSTIKVDTVQSTGGGAVTLTNQHAAKSWLNMNGTSTIAIRDSFNVSSIVDNGTGNYDQVFTNAMDSANYSSTGTCAHDIPISANRDSNFQCVAESASQINLNIFSASQQDRNHVCGQAFGDLA